MKYQKSSAKNLASFEVEKGSCFYFILADK